MVVLEFIDFMSGLIVRPITSDRSGSFAHLGLSRASDLLN